MDKNSRVIPPHIPKEFAGYTVDSYIGHGSYGDVCRVVKADEVDLALKWLRPGVEELGTYRFQNEVWALGKLDHPAIPKLIDQGTYEERPYFVMTLARGSSLRSLYREQLEQRGASAQMRVLAIIATVLDALAHAHDKGILHRDVKDDNVIVTEDLDQISLVDFGFCRDEGRPRKQGASFWNIGAAPYSPPNKLINPSASQATHDVFAVGVLAYLLLTNSYPWGPEEDFGKLRQLMLEKRPDPVHEINSLVDRRISTLIDRLIVTDDHARLTAADARDAVVTLQETLSEEDPVPLMAYGRGTQYRHITRDPVHGDVRLTDYEWKILNTKEFQRLRWIKQLAFANAVYLGAEHTRMHHAVGTLHVVERILQSIEHITGSRIDADKRLLARCYALVHDVSHIAFGHTLEDELSFFDRHDRNADRHHRLFLSNRSEIGDILKSTSFGRQALGLLDPGRKDEGNTDVADLVGGSSGADVLDYIDRDSYFCGLDHKVDSALFRRYKLVDSVTGRAVEPHLISQVYGAHGVRLDAEFALESILVERFALFMKVYTHPAKVAAGAMLGKAMCEAVCSARKPDLEESELEWMGDHEVLLTLRTSRRQLCKRLADRLFRRQLFKAVFRARALKETEMTVGSYEARLRQFEQKELFTPLGRLGAERELCKKTGVEPKDVIVYLPPKAPGLQRVTQYIEKEQGKTTLIDEVHSPYQNIVNRHLKLWNVYVFLPEDSLPRDITEIAEAAQKYFGLENELPLNRRQGVLFG